MTTLGNYVLCGHYDDPQLVAPQLGSLTRGALTIDYYAPTATLRWTSSAMRSLHDALVDADFAFQNITQTVSKVLGPVAGAVEFGTGGKVKAADINAMTQMPLPTCGAALLLEIAGGGRPFDSGFKGACAILARDFAALAGVYGVNAGIFGAVAGIAAGGGLVTFGVTEVMAGGFASAAVVCGGAAAICAIAAALLNGLAGDRIPSREEFGDLMTRSATLSGQPAPSKAELDTAYAALVAGTKAINPNAKTDEERLGALNAAKEKAKRALDIAAKANTDAAVFAGARDAKAGKPLNVSFSVFSGVQGLYARTYRANLVGGATPAGSASIQNVTPSSGGVPGWLLGLGAVAGVGFLLTRKS